MATKVYTGDWAPYSKAITELDGTQGNSVATRSAKELMIGACVQLFDYHSNAVTIQVRSLRRRDVIEV